MQPISAPLDLEQQLAQAREQVQVLRDQLQSTTQERDELREQNDWLKQKLGLRVQKDFGSSSERSMPSQEGLFDEAEALVHVSVGEELPEPTPESIARKVPSKRGGNLTQVAELPVREERIELPAEACTCAHCHNPLHEIGEEVVSRKLEIIPSQKFVHQLTQVRYGCRHCELNQISRPPVVAPLPEQAFPGSMASASAVSYIVAEKFEKGVPLYRQEQYLAGLGLELSRQTMANWVIQCAGLLTRLYNHLRGFLLQQPVLHADETRVQVLREEDRKPQNQSWMWVYCTGGQSPPLVLYDYRMTRSGRHPAEFLQGFNGYLQVDGFEAYSQLEDGTQSAVTLAGCWAHARRKFEDAIKVLPQHARQKGNSPAHQGREFCNRLYAVERALVDLSPEERLAARQEQSAPILAEFKTWLTAQGPTITPKSLLGVAVAYALKQWDKLNVFLRDGNIALDNNRIERAIKPFVIGRKNWLFCNTPRGADAAALLYSLIETAKLNGLVPAAYMEYLLNRPHYLRVADPAALDQLLPWSPAVQAECSKAARKAKSSTLN